MEINFNDHHLIAIGDKSNISPYSHAYRRINDISQVAICITGTNEFILESLKNMVAEMEGDSKKPAQGQTVNQIGCMREVKTPIWNGAEYNTTSYKK